MPARRYDLSTSDRIQIAAKIIAFPGGNVSEVARQAGISRPTVYAVTRKGHRALEAAFGPPPAPLNPEGFWLWEDSNTLKRAIVALRAITGATHAMIVALVREIFALQISEETVREVLQEAYQRAFEYLRGVDLRHVERACCDEMYRWGCCELAGVDADSLFIFLAEKQPRCTAEQWQAVLERLRDEQGLVPDDLVTDGASAIAKAAAQAFSTTRLGHDINHMRRVLDKVVRALERAAYRAIEKADAAWARCEKGATNPRTECKLEDRLFEACLAEDFAIDLAEQIRTAVEQAHGALNIINPSTGRVNTVAAAQATLLEVAAKLQVVTTTAGYEAARYLRGIGQQLVVERQRYVEIMKAIATEQGVPWEVLEAAARLWELDKQFRAATWSGTRERLHREMVALWGALTTTHPREKAVAVVEAVYLERVAKLAKALLMGFVGITTEIMVL